MSASFLCESCAGTDLSRLGLGEGRSEPDHCHGTSDRVTPGVLGGFRCACECRNWLPRPPMALWMQAKAEHPGDPEGRRRRYHDLMVEHGHIIRDGSEVRR